MDSSPPLENGDWPTPSRAYATGDPNATSQELILGKEVVIIHVASYTEYFPLESEAGETPESSANDKQATSHKRRELVRKAQRTHRERKEIYIKSLETEVLQLRTNEANLLQETSKLYAEIGQLRRLLTDLGVPLPLGTAGSSATTAVPRSAVYEITESPSNSVVSGASSGRFQSPTSVEMLSLGAYESAVSGSSPEGTTKADMQNIGVEFVLILESPCLEHIQGNPKEPDASSGHVLTASAPLLFRAPNVESGSQICTTTPWEAPNAGIEKLLNLSQTLELDGEVTPVQATVIPNCTETKPEPAAYIASYHYKVVPGDTQPVGSEPVLVQLAAATAVVPSTSTASAGKQAELLVHV
ncbi:hypothetical protein V502_02692 [Pseudogymnoascus sp. VKM F-4520 (FW-2644)]|nr:hypothetical protein V502_02692 [Pseudogymnoascus sp. VKM F-4520 (FW-2644)]